MIVLAVVMVVGDAGVDGDSVSGAGVDSGYVGGGISDGVVAVVVAGVCTIGGGYGVGSSGVRGCGDRVSDPPPPFHTTRNK